MIVPYLLITITESLLLLLIWEPKASQCELSDRSLPLLRAESDRTRPVMLNDRFLSLTCDHRIIAALLLTSDMRAEIQSMWSLRDQSLPLVREQEVIELGLWSLNDRSLPLVWEQEVIELGLHLAAERLPTLIAEWSLFTSCPRAGSDRTRPVIAEWSLLTSCLRAGSDRTRPVIAEWSLLTSCPRAGSDRTRPASCSRAPGDCDRWDSWWRSDDRLQLSRSRQGRQHLFSGGKEELFHTLEITKENLKRLYVDHCFKRKLKDADPR
jgi:hypothetical protein